MQNSYLFCKKKKNILFSILHIHFYKILTSVYLFYHLFYLNNNISLIFYYIKQTTTHMAPPTSLFLFLTPTLSFSLNHLLLSCFPFPSSFFSLFFLFLQQIFQTQTNLTAAIIALPPLSHRHQQPKSTPIAATHLQSWCSATRSPLDFILVLVNFGVWFHLVLAGSMMGYC